MFSTVKVRKPEASRDRSREVYIVATGYKGWDKRSNFAEIL